MSEDVVNRFLDLVAQQEPLRDDIKRSLDATADRAAATVELAAGLGYRFSSADLVRALERRYGGGELGEDQLEHVSGGALLANANFSARGGGVVLLAAFPDVCKTPGPPAPFVPVPYPNVSGVDAKKGS